MSNSDPTNPTPVGNTKILKVPVPSDPTLPILSLNNWGYKISFMTLEKLSCRWAVLSLKGNWMQLWHLHLLGCTTGIEKGGAMSGWSAVKTSASTSGTVNNLVTDSGHSFWVWALKTCVLYWVAMFNNRPYSYHKSHSGSLLLQYKSSPHNSCISTQLTQ